MLCAFYESTQSTCTCTCIYAHVHVHVDCVPFCGMMPFSGISKSIPGRTRAIIRLHNVDVPGSVVWTKMASCLSAMLTSLL